MAEELPDDASDPYMSPDGVESRKRRLPLTWMILLPLLLVAIGMLASDRFRGLMPRNAAFELINNKLMHQQSDDSGGFGAGAGDKQSKPLTAEGVHELLGRQPDLVEVKKANLNGQSDPDVQMEPIVVETYKFPGIIKSYTVVVTYLENATDKDQPPTTALQNVRKE